MSLLRLMLFRGLRSKWLYMLPFVCCLQAYGQPQLSSEAQVSLMTCAPSDALYASWGHTAFRVKDPIQGLDLIYNYGTFNFNAPNFYGKFIRGKLNYMLNVERFQDFYRQYTYLQRSVYEQVLNLSPEQKQHLFEFLVNNAREENKDYLYDPIFDNCATRPRDVLLNTLEGSVHFPDLHAESPLTFRDILDEYMTHNSWVDLGIDLILGKKMDAPTRPYDQMFIPDYLMREVSRAVIRESGGAERPLVASGTYILRFNDTNHPSGLPHPLWLTGLLLMLALLVSAIGWRKKTYRYGFDLFFFALLGIMGVVMLFMWMGTDHQITRDNFNLLWAWPLHLLVAPFLVGKRRTWVVAYFILAGGISALLLLSWGHFFQEFHPAVWPFMLIVVLRSILIWRNWR